MNKKPLVIAAFPCCGKSTALKRKSDKVIIGIDEDYKEKHGRINYIKRIDENKDADIITITPSDPVLRMLHFNHIDFILVYPEDNEECKEEWKHRSIERGSKSWTLTELMWHSVLKDFKNNKWAKAHYTLKSNEYLSDIIDKIYEEQSGSSECDEK